MSELPQPAPEPVATPPAAAVPSASPSHSLGLDPTLRIFGALLWAYVVLGEWVVGLHLPEPVALLLLAATLGISWARAVRADWLPLYKLRPGLIAVTLWLGLLVLVSLLPASPRPLDAIVSATLTFVAVGCSWLGRLGTKPPVTWRERLWATAARVVAWLVTLLAVGSGLNRL